MAKTTPKGVRQLRNDGPTLEEFVAQGYKAEDYPPPGYAPREAEGPAAEKVQVRKTVMTTDHKVFFKGEVEVEPDLAQRIRDAHKRPKMVRVDDGEPPAEEEAPAGEPETAEEMEARIRAEIAAEAEGGDQETQTQTEGEGQE